MPAVKQSKLSRITGLVSGHRDKADKLAAQYGVASDSIYSYENFDSILANKNIDAVYIGLPNSMHAEYTIRAAKAGKHVLCEKPMATSVGDCKAMIEACRQADRKLMIAYRLQLEPTTLRARELVRDGSLGTIQAIESANGFNIAQGEWRTDRKLGGGGPLMDMGIYSLNGCRFLTGEEPSDLAAYASTIDHDGRFDQVEENVSWTMKFPSGIVAACNTSYGAQMDGYYRVHGSKGVMEVTAAFGYEGQHLKVEFVKPSESSGLQRRPSIDELNPSHDPSHFVREADHFSSCILENKTPQSPGEEGLRDMELIARIYKSAGLEGKTLAGV
jgi:predicted dehydrogenase